MGLNQNAGGSTHESASLWDHSISFIANASYVKDHYHQCYKVVVSLDDTFDCCIDGQLLTGLRSLVINQTVPHSFDAKNTHLLMSFVKVDSPYGLQLRALLADKACINLNSFMAPGQLENIMPANYNELSNNVLIPHVKAFMNSIFFMTRVRENFVMDVRISVALLFIEQNLQGPLDLERIASKINLSIDRTRHLFITETGTSFSQYVLWKRIRKTLVAAIDNQASLSESCYHFGFVDQAHFNKSFKRYFGLTPGMVLRSTRLLY